MARWLNASIASVKVTQSIDIKKMNTFKSYENNPPHLFLPNTKYFITCSTLNKYPYLESDEAKWATFDYLKNSLSHFDWELEDWVILDNHIHMMVNSPKKAETLSSVIENFHKFTANWLSRNQINKKGTKYFHNYWDTCITYEKSYYSRLNYIWYNPVKHGYVDSPEKWKFGSFYYRFTEDEINMKNIFEKHPFNQLKIKDDF
jgi:putative transposase